MTGFLYFSIIISTKKHSFIERMRLEDENIVLERTSIEGFIELVDSGIHFSIIDLNIGEY
jgi:hypothetical protein